MQLCDMAQGQPGGGDAAMLGRLKADSMGQTATDDPRMFYKGGGGARMGR
jgi:hypothetical protein